MLVFLKLGGSLITDKSAVEKARSEDIARLSEEIAAALQARSDLSLVIGHGSGSFGHTIARQHNTRSGVWGRDAWIGFSKVAYSASRLNSLVLDGLHKAGVPALRFQASASAMCCEGQITELAIEPIQHALNAGLVPLVYGDVAMDEIWGGTIISTEEILVYLAHSLTPASILIAGDYEGVLGADGQVISLITPPTLDDVQAVLGASEQVDVTGGMASKVAQMLALCQSMPELKVRIFSGVDKGNVFRTLTEEVVSLGTCISA